MKASHVWKGSILTGVLALAVIAGCSRPLSVTPVPAYVNTRTSTATLTSTLVNTSTATPSFTATQSFTHTHTRTNTLVPTATNTAVILTATSTLTLSPTRTNTGVPTSTSTLTSTNSPTHTATSTSTNTRTATPTPTNTGILTATPTSTFTPCYPASVQTTYTFESGVDCWGPSTASLPYILSYGPSGTQASQGSNSLGVAVTNSTGTPQNIQLNVTYASPQDLTGMMLVAQIYVDPALAPSDWSGGVQPFFQSGPDWGSAVWDDEWFTVNNTPPANVGAWFPVTIMFTPGPGDPTQVLQFGIQLTGVPAGASGNFYIDNMQILPIPTTPTSTSTSTPSATPTNTSAGAPVCTVTPVAPNNFNESEAASAGGATGTNEACANAEDLGTANSTNSIQLYGSLLSSGNDGSNYLSSVDWDYYLVTIGENGNYTFSLDCYKPTGSPNDMDLLIFDSGCNYLGGSFTGDVNYSEFLNSPPLTAGQQYYVAVVGWDAPAQSPYRLVVTGQAAPTNTPTNTPTGTPTFTPKETPTLPSATDTPTSTSTPTPTPTSIPACTPSLLNGAESLSENGTWTGGPAATRNLSGSNATQGVSSMDVNITAAAGWNDNILRLGGFAPSNWTGVTQFQVDVYADASVVTGNSYNEIVLYGDSSTNGLYYKKLCSTNAAFVAGANTLTFTMDYPDTITAGMLLSELRFIYNNDNAGGGLGHLYFDNLRLTYAVCPPTPTPTAGPCTPVLFNGMETLAENGAWTGGANATRTLSALNATQGSSSMDVNITTVAGWNDDVLRLAGFGPSNLSSYVRVMADVYADGTVLGLGYSELLLYGDSSTNSIYYQRLSSSGPALTPGTQTITWDLDYPGTITSGMAISELRFIYNTSGDGSTGHLYIDNIRLVTGPGPCP